MLNCCTWAAGYGTNQCDISTPGMSSMGILFCLAEVTIQKVPCDAAAPEVSGVIQSIVKSGADVGRFVSVATNAAGESLLTVQGTESLNDNGGKTRNETLVGQGSLAAADMCFLNSFLGKEVVYIAELNDGKIGCWGHDGGLRLTEWGYVIGQSTDDFIGTNFTFTNSSRELMKFINLAIDGTLADYTALEVALTT